ncbi:hypothetical protein D3C83_203570 [compost metagenome]
MMHTPYSAIAASTIATVSGVIAAVSRPTISPRKRSCSWLTRMFVLIVARPDLLRCRRFAAFPEAGWGHFGA